MRFVACLFFVACASTPPPPPASEPPPLIVEPPTPPPVDLAPPPATSATVLGYEQCPLLFIEGEGTPRGTPPKLTAWPIDTLATFPDPVCAEVDGWAGVSFAQWGLAGGFSADSKSYLHCGNGTPSCVLMDVATRAITRPYPAKSDANSAPDGIFSDPAIKRGVRYYQITTTPGPWADNNTFVRWSLELVAVPDSPKEHVRALVYRLYHRISGVQLDLATFLAPSDKPLAVILPEPAVISPDGNAIALRATVQDGQSLSQMVRLVRFSDLLTPSNPLN